MRRGGRSTGWESPYRSRCTGERNELNHSQHGYEELRDVVIYILLNAPSNGVDKFDKLLEMTALALCKQDGGSQGRQYFSHGSATQLHPNDSDQVLEIVWDLFRQGVLTLGLNASNPGWPWFRLSRFGENALQQSLYRFHDRAGFRKRLHSEVTDISPDAVVYLEEAVAAFYADCLLSTCIMLGVAAESEFFRLLDVAKLSGMYGNYFSRIGDGLHIRAKMAKFQEAIKPTLSFLSKSVADGLENNFNMIGPFFASGGMNRGARLEAMRRRGTKCTSISSSSSPLPSS
jgi:hypothetical protein